MRKVALFMLLLVSLWWVPARAGDSTSVVAAATASEDAGFAFTLALSPLEGAIPLLTRDCPVLCKLEQGKSCPGGDPYPLTEPCYDDTRLICRSCYCSANYTWNCYPMTV
jgi:hypothetical protein